MIRRKLLIYGAIEGPILFPLLGEYTERVCFRRLPEYLYKKQEKDTPVSDSWGKVTKPTLTCNGIHFGSLAGSVFWLLSISLQLESVQNRIPKNRLIVDHVRTW